MQFTHCLHEHEGKCKKDECGHEGCDNLYRVGDDELAKAKAEIHAVLKKWNVEIDIDWYGDRCIELRYFSKDNLRLINSIKLDE